MSIFLVSSFDGNEVRMYICSTNKYASILSTAYVDCTLILLYTHKLVRTKMFRHMSVNLL